MRYLTSQCPSTLEGRLRMNTLGKMSALDTRAVLTTGEFRDDSDYASLSLEFSCVYVANIGGIV